jgi:pyochelin biosynthetic protein PchC
VTARVLLCIPHAGAGGNEYRPWRSRFARWDAVSVCLPGRQARFREPFLSSVTRMADFVVEHERTDASEFALFGHSLGALVAFEVALRLERRGKRVVGLVVAGSSAVRGDRPPIHDLADASLLEELTKLGGLAPEIAAETELLDLILPRIRADLRAAETYAPGEGRVSCPVLALGGTCDLEVPPTALEGWRERTSGPVEVRLVEGGHFFVQSHAEQVADLVGSCLERWSMG